MPPTRGPQSLSRRERQIMEVLYREGKATVAEVLEGLEDPPSYSSVRALLRILEEKGHAKHEQVGPRYLFRPSVPRDKARVSALRELVGTFFQGSPSELVNTLVDLGPDSVSQAELEEISRLIEKARQEGR